MLYLYLLEKGLLKRMVVKSTLKGLTGSRTSESGLCPPPLPQPLLLPAQPWSTDFTLSHCAWWAEAEV